ncbi:MAG TPA: SDR family oxidoreductase [Reyranella sp.]|nr:SDR family oxidoreductase [Reyranella sp.]
MTGVLLITGGASGIGAETARRAAKRGYKVAINYRTRDAQAMGLAADIAAQDGEAIALPGDMASEAEIVRLFDETERVFGKITHLVNSAGIGGGGVRVRDFDAQALQQLFTVNVVGLMLCCREAVRRMSTKRGGKGGAIVNISSMAGTIGGRPGASHYAASKAAVDSFTMGFAKDVAAEGVRVNSLRPGMVLTEMTEQRLKDDDFRAGIEATIAMGRVGRADEIANAALWLLSDEASFISGACLDASGGGFVFGKR